MGIQAYQVFWPGSWLIIHGILMHVLVNHFRNIHVWEGVLKLTPVSQRGSGIWQNLGAHPWKIGKIWVPLPYDEWQNLSAPSPRPKKSLHPSNIFWIVPNVWWFCTCVLIMFFTNQYWVVAQGMIEPSHCKKMLTQFNVCWHWWLTQKDQLNEYKYMVGFYLVHYHY